MAARSGTSFAHLAEEYSDDSATAEIGGSLGWVRRGQLASALDEAAFQLKVGEISGIVQSAFGFHILRLVATADDHESAFPTAPKFHKLPVAPPDASLEQSRASVSRWPDPNDPRQMGVGKTISELRELCYQHSALPLGGNSNSKSSEYECALEAIPMDPDYEKFVDRIATLQKQACRLFNGSLPERAPVDPELARVWEEVQFLAKEWGKRSVALMNDLERPEAAEARERQDADAELSRETTGDGTRNLSEAEKILKQQLTEKHRASVQERQNSRLQVQLRAQRLVLDWWRVNSNCGHGL